MSADPARWALGVDVGGTAIKGALVDLVAGAVAAEPVELPTPADPDPDAVAEVVAQVAARFGVRYQSIPVGVAVPAVVTAGFTRTAANISDAWIGAPAREIIGRRLGRPIALMNDADAAGLAEAAYGAARGHDGSVIVVTLGTGIGTALLTHGVLFPNTELGHLELDGAPVGDLAAASVKSRGRLSFGQYAERLQHYLEYLEKLFWPELFVLGGGISMAAEEFLPQLSLDVPVVAAKLRNQAGIVGAARFASVVAGRTV